MADALEKYIKYQMSITPDWRRKPEVVSRNGKIATVHDDGHTWVSDNGKEEEEMP